MAEYLYERITADDIQDGDEVARARTHTFVRIEHVQQNPATVTLYSYMDPWGRKTPRRVIFARPRKTAKWWRRYEQPELSRAEA